MDGSNKIIALFFIFIFILVSPPKVNKKIERRSLFSNQKKNIFKKYFIYFLFYGIYSSNFDLILIK